MAWQEAHRRDSPYPLRHNGTNVFVTGFDGTETTFSSYIFVTKIVDGNLQLVERIVEGAIRAGVDGAPRLSELEWYSIRGLRPLCGSVRRSFGGGGRRSWRSRLMLSA